VTFAEALAEVLRHASEVRPGATEVVSLLESAGRVLAGAVMAERDQPPFARSTRDGFAVRAGDVAPRRGLRVVGIVRAGQMWKGGELRAGEAVEIMTGAPMPVGSDAVLMVEHASMTEGDWLFAEEGRELRVGENVVAQGAEALAGAEVVPVGRRVGAAEIAAAANCGCARLEVFERPKGAVVATGDELVELDEAPEAWQIRNSNSYALTSLVRDEGGEAERLEIARDTVEDLLERIARGREADLLLLSGGVSMGKYDLVEQVLREWGAEFFFTGAMTQPGKPVVFGRLPKEQGLGIRDPGLGGGWTYFFGLPGNPISTEVCFRLFVAPMLRGLAGATELGPRFAEARLVEDVKGGAKVTRFLPAEVGGDWQGVGVRVVPWQGSGDLAANARANGFVVLPGGVAGWRAGEVVRVLLR
jgi:molybdopterin molybdotransferase